MKSKLISTITILLTVIAMSWSQDGNLDKVVMVNGEVKMGHVTGISDTEVQFVHDKETISYTFQKARISKIEFGSSGRIEIYNDVVPTTSATPNLADHHNKIAILPFAYVRDGRQLKNDIAETKVQKQFFSLMNGHIGKLKVQDPQTTNALLHKNGVTDETFDNFMMPEIANMLGVEYVVHGILTINGQGSTSYSSNYSSYTAKKDKQGTNKWSVGSTSSTLKFNTIIDLTLYNDTGDVVYAHTKESFWPTDDAYPMTLKFLLKRMPIYTK